MPFNQEEVSKLLVECHRRCCICHRFCGIKMETDHIKPKSEGGNDSIDNAIPLCFECHAEVHLYNDKHPLGRKYRSQELKLHKNQWLGICKTNPNILVQELKPSDSGPLISLLSELEYNHTICGITILYANREFQNSISNGILSFIDDGLKEEIMSTYSLINLINVKMNELHKADKTLQFPYQRLQQETLKEQKETDQVISNCMTSIKEFLNKE